MNWWDKIAPERQGECNRIKQLAAKAYALTSPMAKSQQKN